MDQAIDKAASVVSIDENHLDRECIRLPGDYLKYAHLGADSKRDLDEADNELKVVQADLAKDIRQNPGKYGIEKITEDAIKAVILTHKTTQTQAKKVAAIRHTNDLVQAVVWAIEAKKKSLAMLVELHGMGYFSNAKVSPAGKEAVEKMTQTKVRRRSFED